MRYEPQIREVFRELGVPEELALLPHVESSFRNHVRSRYGAAGMWQFMPATGRIYMTVDEVVDQRLIPKYATRAAAKLLKSNYRKLGTWPLAITAYNHGPAGMRRAVRKVGTTDFATIVAEYDGRTFGFASRNFYAQFLAAKRAAGDYETHFGKLPPLPITPLDVVELPVYLDARVLTDHLGIDEGAVADLNLALRDSVWNAQKWIPAGYELHLPKGTVGEDTQAWLASLPGQYKHAQQKMRRFHVVKRGETLGGIASKYNASVKRLLAINNIKNANRIYPGQKIELTQTR